MNRYACGRTSLMTILARRAHWFIQNQTKLQLSRGCSRNKLRNPVTEGPINIVVLHDGDQDVFWIYPGTAL